MFKTLFKKRSEDIHASTLYTAILAQSRRPEFYGQGRIADSYDGRIDLLSLNLGIIMHSLRRFDAAGQTLTQALYDVMIEDFNIAMREEGLADTGISRRIKPMVQKFYARLTALHECLNGKCTAHSFVTQQLLGDSADSDFAQALTLYIERSADQLDGLDLIDIQNASFSFTELGLSQ